MKKFILFFLAILLSVISFSQNREGLAQLSQKVRPGFLLGSFASGGLTSPDGEVLQELFRKEFNIITIGVYMKSTQPEPGIFRLENYDKLVDFATKNNIEIYLHPLIGGNQYTADWVNKGNHSADELRSIMRERITTILTRHGDKIDYADVVNEALNGLDSEGNIIWKTEGHAWMKMGWYEGKKYKLPNYIVEAFRIAREVGHKDLKLILNHPKNDTPDARLTEATWQLYHAMVHEGIPIDGIGFQMHIRLQTDGTVTDNHDYPWTAVGFEKILKRYEKAGIDVHITEFDVHIQKQPASQEHLEIQAEIYRDVLERAIKSPAVKTFKTWGFTDKYSWKERKLDGTPLLFDKSFNPKPAYIAQYELLKDFENYPYQTLKEVFGSIGFDPSVKGKSFFVVTSDVHYGTQSKGMGYIIEDINKMDKKPSFFCVNGDMISHASSHFGAVPDEKDRQLAIKEFQQFREAAHKLDKQVELKMVLGNHDTHPLEVDPEIFWEVFPDYPVYQSTDLESVHIIFLNGHSTGYIDPAQMKWLEQDIQKISTKKTVILFVHQPAMGATVGERGIPAAISKAFEKHKGQIWYIGGHGHNNSQTVFQLKNTLLIQHEITCGAEDVWGGPERPGYWIYCLNNGQVTGRIFKQKTKGYRTEPVPDLEKARKVTVPFENLSGIIWKTMVDDSDSKNFVEVRDTTIKTWVHQYKGNGGYMVSAVAEYCLNYWAYVVELTYSLPLKETGNSATTIAILTNHRSQSKELPGQYFISADSKQWQEISLKESKPSLLLFSIPESLRESEKIFFRFVPAGQIGAQVGGYALLK